MATNFDSNAIEFLLTLQYQRTVTLIEKNKIPQPSLAKVKRQNKQNNANVQQRGRCMKNKT